MPYRFVAGSPTVAHLAILRTTHHRLLPHCIGWKRKHRDGYHLFSYADALAKTVCGNVLTTVRKRRVRFAGFVVRMVNESQLDIGLLVCSLFFVLCLCPFLVFLLSV